MIYINKTITASQDLFRNNKLEYVYVYINKSDSNVVGSIPVSCNTEMLRLIVVKSKKKVSIKFDIS